MGPRWDHGRWDASLGERQPLGDHQPEQDRRGLVLPGSQEGEPPDEQDHGREEVVPPLGEYVPPGPDSLGLISDKIWEMS